VVPLKSGCVLHSVLEEMITTRLDAFSSSCSGGNAKITFSL